jgi:histidinol-phosphate aminotransferase
MSQDRSRVLFSRRSFLGASTAASAALAFGTVTEPLLAMGALRELPQPSSRGAVFINANENPLGPCDSARKALADIIPSGGRYLYDRMQEFVKSYAKAEGLKPEYVNIYPGSSTPLQYAVLAFTSPNAPYVTADPSFESGMFAAGDSGAHIVKVPLTKSYAHDVKAMLAAAPNAGLFYVCTPNNPTGTLTSHADIEYLVANKPKGSIVMVDEAYIHFTEAPSVLDLVKADRDVVVLRTMSKIYGMAGLRCGFAIARPDLLKKMARFAGWVAMPVTAVAAASASLNDQQLVSERRRINADIRQDTFDWLDRNGYSYIPSQSNCFMLDAKRPAREIIAAMARQNIYIGRVWPIWPTHVRITVGTAEEMERFRTAFHQVMTAAKST